METFKGDTLRARHNQRQGFQTVRASEPIGLSDTDHEQTRNDVSTVENYPRKSQNHRPTDVLN